MLEMLLHLKIQLYPLKSMKIKDTHFDCIQNLEVLDTDHNEVLAATKVENIVELDDACSLNNLEVIYYNGKMQELFRRQVKIQQSSFCFNSIPSSSSHRGMLIL